MSFSPPNIGSQQVVGQKNFEHGVRVSEQCRPMRTENTQIHRFRNARKRKENVGIRTIFNPLTER